MLDTTRLTSETTIYGVTFDVMLLGGEKTPLTCFGRKTD